MSTHTQHSTRRVDGSTVEAPTDRNGTRAPQPRKLTAHAKTVAADPRSARSRTAPGRATPASRKAPQGETAAHIAAALAHQEQGLRAEIEQENAQRRAERRRLAARGSLDARGLFLLAR